MFIMNYFLYLNNFRVYMPYLKDTRTHIYMYVIDTTLGSDFIKDNVIENRNENEMSL